MANVRSKAELDTIFADNFTGNISPQDIRDFVATMYQWVFGPISTKTDDYTFVDTDVGATIRANKASAITFTVDTNANQAFEVREKVNVFNVGAGDLTIAGPGVTLNGDVAFKQFEGGYVQQVAIDEWDIHHHPGNALVTE